MEKTVTLNLRVNPTTKKSAEDVLARLGFPMSIAIDMYLRQIALTGGIPFRVELSQAPDAINADIMTTAEIYTKLLRKHCVIWMGYMRISQLICNHRKMLWGSITE